MVWRTVSARYKLIVYISLQYIIIVLEVLRCGGMWGYVRFVFENIFHDLGS